jgi:phosphoglycolate phosphatase
MTEMKRYKACFFDLDGTLTDSAASIAKAVNVTFDRYGLKHITREDAMVMAGDGFRVLLEKALKNAGDEELSYFDRVCLDYPEIFIKYCTYENRPYEGIPEFLTFLRAHGIKTAVITNKPEPHARIVLNDAFPGYSFDFIIGETEGVPKKPAPDMVFRAMEAMGLKKEEILYFGDTNTDMQTARNAGVDCVGVTWGFRGRKELQSYSPAYIIDKPCEIETEVIK